MHFFEKPKQVTAVVFFVQTIIALLNMKHFLYLGSYFFIVILFFVGFPFLFYYVYNIILNDLEKDKEDPEMIHFNKNEDADHIVGKKEQNEDAFESPINEATEKLEVEAELVSEPESSGELEQVNLEVPVKIADAMESKPSERRSRVEARKQIQVISFVDDEPASEVEKVVPIIEPVVIKKGKPHRQKRKQQASKEAMNLAKETKTVENLDKNDSI